MTLPGHTCVDAVRTPGDSDELLDGGSIAQLRETLTSEMRARLIATFEQSLPEILAEIAQAAGDSDGVGVRRAAHMLRGSSAMLGARRLAGACLRVEHDRAREVAISEADLEELRSLAARTCEALRRELVDDFSSSGAPST
jgi:HPt (histidine-containing phosphotransfer) domain-containing protein